MDTPIKKGIRRILARYPLLHSLAEGVVLFFLLRRSRPDIESHANRHLRARILRRGIESLRQAMRRVHYRHGILVTSGEVYSYSDGIFLDLKGTNRYLKVAGEVGGNEGKKLLGFLTSKGIAVRGMIDLGANFGEISLYFSKQCPHAKILAVEPSSDNFKILEQNCRMQSFLTKNIILLREAVSDARGVAEISKGISPENILVRAGIHRKEADAALPKSPTETVASDTLESLMSRFGFQELDFLKVDIEGSEPLLYASLMRLLPRIKAVLIEAGDKADHAAYLPLARLLWEYGDCFDRESERNFASFEEVSKELLSSPVCDLWFVRRNL